MFPEKFFDSARDFFAVGFEHEKRVGQRDANWTDWYAAYMVAEQSGKQLPQ